MKEPQLQPVVDGPFGGMMANARVDSAPGILAFIQNFLVRDGALYPRPGILAVGSAIGGGNDVQGIYQWEMLDGTAYTVAFADGDLYALNWATSTWTMYGQAGTDYTLSTTGDINCATSRGRLIFTDGTNKPVMATGPVGSIAFTTLTNAPVAHRVGIYYDKVFFWDIPGSENQFEWSDEGDPVNGYAGDNQAWEFAQTDAGRILGMAPLNERNLIFKEDSGTMLMGEADENFQTRAVREGLSETEGCVAGGSIVVLDGDVYLVSANGLRRVRQGQIFESLHDLGGVDILRDVWSGVNKSALSASLGWVDRAERHVGWLIPQGSTSTLDTAIVFNTQNSSFTTFKFTGFDFTAVGSVEDTSGNEWVMFGDGGGNLYKYRIGQAQTSDNGTAIEYKARKRISDSSHIKKRMVEGHFLLSLAGDFQGEIRPYIDGSVLVGKQFGVYNETGEKRYRRGFNSCGYETGWELYSNRVQAMATIQKVTVFQTAVEMSEDWNG